MKAVLWAGVLSVVFCVGARAGQVTPVNVTCTGSYGGYPCDAAIDRITNDWTIGSYGPSYWLGRQPGADGTLNETLSSTWATSM